VDPVHP